MKTLKTLIFLAFFIFGSALFSVRAWASCNTSTLVTTPDSSSVQACINAATSGQTVTVQSGSATWTTQLTSSVPITLAGATVCTGSGDPYGVTSGVVTCTDNTNITLASSSGGLATSGCPTRITGFTFNQTYTNSNGAINMSGTHGNDCFRFDHNHYMTVYGLIESYGSYGLIDHNLIQDTSTSGAGPLLLLLEGDFATRGYQNWIDATSPGSNQAVYVEQNEITSTNTLNPYGAYDSHYGGKIVLRFNTLNGLPFGLTHGTDSGQARSAVLNEDYGNELNNPPTNYIGVFSTRGGQVLLWGNVANGSPWASIPVDLQYYRVLGQSHSVTWGTGGPGLNWTPVSATITNVNATVATLNAADFAASQAYAALATVGPLTNNPGGFNFQLTNGPRTCGTYPSSWNQTFPGGTTTDSAGCIWINVGGSTAASPAPGTAAGFCAANKDTPCSANSTCSALSPGDTCSCYMDGLGGVYPFRDQPGRTHNQQLSPNYEWLNTGASLPTPIFGTDSGTSSIVVANRDYYDYTSSFTGASGTGSGTLAARPSTCTTGVAYWATDQGNWNTSGNGFGQGVLYQCSATNTWTTYYTPYTYPYPLVLGPAPAPPTGLKATVD
jgi:hypothetical protein